MDFRRYVRDRLPPLAIAREPEIADELAEHLSDLYEEAVAAGLDPDAARARAAAALPEHTDALARDIQLASRAWPSRVADRLSASLSEPTPASSGRWSMFSGLRMDLRYAIRSLLRAPAFTTVVVFTMAVGIGASAVIFGAVDAVLVRDLPIANPERVAAIYSMRDERSRFSTSSYPDYVSIRDRRSARLIRGLSSIDHERCRTTSRIPSPVSV